MKQITIRTRRLKPTAKYALQFNISCIFCLLLLIFYIGFTLYVSRDAVTIPMFIFNICNICWDAALTTYCIIQTVKFIREVDIYKEESFLLYIFQKGDEDYHTNDYYTVTEYFDYLLCVDSEDDLEIAQRFSKKHDLIDFINQKTDLYL